MRLALLSNVTADLLAGMLKKNHDVYLSAGFDTWQQDIIIPESDLYAFKPQSVVILLHAGAYEWENYEKSIQLIEEWCTIFKVLTERLPDIPVFIASIDVKMHCLYGSEANKARAIENYLNEKVNELHKNGAKAYVLPVKDTIADIGRNTFYSSKMWYVGSMPYSIKGLTAINDLINNYVSVTKGMHKKCLAVDLDNTLWGGVIGEDGVDNILLSSHKEGARYYDTQKILKKMKNQGVMLAVLSKNNAEDVEPVYSHPDMLLKKEDFVAEVINWNPKSVNIRQLAKDLNIGLDSFVFLDDNPAEREQMKAECPEVTVIDFPKDSSMLPEVVEKAYYDYFFSLEVTGEDANKTQMYRAETQRKAELSSAASLDDFLKKLEMTMEIHRMRPEEEKRVVQLVNKTNQFNVTTQRYSAEEIKALSKSGDVITVHMSDKYGDQGLVAVLILKYERNIAEIDTFLMSCRVMGRNAENEIVARVKKMLESKGISVVRASYYKTSKNAPVENLFEKLGFTIAKKADEYKKYICNVSELPDVTGSFKEVSEDLI